VPRWAVETGPAVSRHHAGDRPLTEPGHLPSKSQHTKCISKCRCAVSNVCSFRAFAVALGTIKCFAAVYVPPIGVERRVLHCEAAARQATNVVSTGGSVPRLGDTAVIPYTGHSTDRHRPHA
jgi:hypothetical protein